MLIDLTKEISYFNKEENSLNLYGMNIFITPIVDGLFEIYPKEVWAPLNYGMVPFKIVQQLRQNFERKFDELTQQFFEYCDPNIPDQKPGEFFNQTLSITKKIWTDEILKKIVSTILNSKHKKFPKMWRN